MTRRIRWITRETALAAHARSLKDHGGAAGIRDEGLLGSALSRPQNLAAYGDPSIFEMAAALGFGIVKNHPFVDGNKRTAFLSAYVFLGLNGWSLEADEAEAAAITFDLASGDATESEFARWLEACCVSVGASSSETPRKRSAPKGPKRRGASKTARKIPRRKGA